MKHLMALATFALVLVSGCTHSPGGPTLMVRESNQPSSMVIDPEEVQRESPPLYALLEDAYQGGSVETKDKEAKESTEDYLEAKGRSIPIDVEYRSMVFSISYLSG